LSRPGQDVTRVRDRLIDIESEAKSIRFDSMVRVDRDRLAQALKDYLPQWEWDVEHFPMAKKYWEGHEDATTGMYQAGWADYLEQSPALLKAQLRKCRADVKRGGITNVGAWLRKHMITALAVQPVRRE
jgi:hypothetical protein